MDVEELKRKLARFAAERDWGQFHNPKNLAMALSAEAGELLEIFQWLTPEESVEVPEDPKAYEAVREELADILIYLIRIADQLDIDLDNAVSDKITSNAARYPVELAKGNAVKRARRSE